MLVYHMDADDSSSTSSDEGYCGLKCTKISLNLLTDDDSLDNKALSYNDNIFPQFVKSVEYEEIIYKKVF